MKNLAILLIGGILAAPSISLAAPIDFYGIAHVSIDSISGTTDDLQVKSHSSRLGVKGEKTFKGDLQGFYKFEFQVDMADDTSTTVPAATETKVSEKFVKSRNMYVGIKDKDLGSLLIGRHDTAMKKAIGIKIFSDTVAEMTSVMGKDAGLYNRTDNTIFYRSKKFGAVQVMASVSTLESDADNKSFDVQSFGATYKTKNIFVGVASESVDAGQKGNRLTIGYTFDAGHKVGLGVESGEDDTAADHDAYVVNGIFKVSDLYKIKATYGKRTSAEDETAFGIGFVRDLGDKSELYAIYHSNEDDNAAPATDVQTVSLGMTYVF